MCLDWVPIWESIVNLTGLKDKNMTSYNTISQAGDYKRQNGEDMKIHPVWDSSLNRLAFFSFALLDLYENFQEDFRRDFDLNGAYRGDNTGKSLPKTYPVLIIVFFLTIFLYLGKLGPAEMFRCDQVVKNAFIWLALFFCCRNQCQGSTISFCAIIFWILEVLISA